MAIDARYLPEPFERHHTLQIHDFYRQLRALGMQPATPRLRGLSLKAGSAATRAGAVRFIGRRPRKTYFSCLMWPSAARIFPYAYRSSIIPFIFDCWPPEYPAWEKLLSRLDCPMSFFTSRASAQHFADLGIGGEVQWLAEAIDTDLYLGTKPLRDRPVAVTEMGRRYEPAHEAIVEALADSSLTHVYADGKTLFPDRASLVAGLKDSSSLVCYPKSVTHPDSAGGLETATLRYFEGMAAGCLLVGRAPRELVDLCGYNPVLEMGPDEIRGQLAAVLTWQDPEHQRLVDRNRRWVVDHASWEVRARQVMSTLGRPGAVDHPSL